MPARELNMSARELKRLNADIALIDIPEVRAEIEREDAEYRETVMRDLCSSLSFWIVCRGKRCKRFKRCEGDTETCFTRHWPLVCGDAKLFAHAHMKTTVAGIERPEIAAELNRRFALGHVRVPR
jgi:hypothetical protein